jgi:hypothetical protein
MPMSRFVQLSSQRTLEPVRQDGCFAEKQAPALRSSSSSRPGARRAASRGSRCVLERKRRRSRQGSPTGTASRAPARGARTCHLSCASRARSSAQGRSKRPVSAGWSAAVVQSKQERRSDLRAVRSRMSTSASVSSNCSVSWSTSTCDRSRPRRRGPTARGGSERPQRAVVVVGNEDLGSWWAVSAATAGGACAGARPRRLTARRARRVPAHVDAR